MPLVYKSHLLQLTWKKFFNSSSSFILSILFFPLSIQIQCCSLSEGAKVAGTSEHKMNAVESLMKRPQVDLFNLRILHLWTPADHRIALARTHRTDSCLTKAGEKGEKSYSLLKLFLHSCFRPSFFIDGAITQLGSSDGKF